jgi:hypothetical protein
MLEVTQAATSLLLLLQQLVVMPIEAAKLDCSIV